MWSFFSRVFMFHMGVEVAHFIPTRLGGVFKNTLTTNSHPVEVRGSSQ